MKIPNLGKRTFLIENKDNILSTERFLKEKDTMDTQPLYTGRYFLISKQENDADFAKNKVFSESIFTVAHTNDFKNHLIQESDISDANVLVYDTLGIALFNGDDNEVKVMESVSEDFIIIPEKIAYIPNDSPFPYPTTWGLSQTKVSNSKYTGKDVKIAILDTGLDDNHPDFQSRNLVKQSFVPNQNTHDLHGHGTHCIGTACGNIDMHGTRYGVAQDSIIYVGKVLNNQGSGAQSWILNGMLWAINNGCQVISMSLGSSVLPNQGYDTAYERVAKSALNRGCIIVAAAGNDSSRSMNYFAPVNSPADCPSIISVGAVDSALNIADFSNRSINSTGNIDIVSAGVGIYSSWTMPLRYRTISGTSMATPHVAGILALLWEKYPNYKPIQIITELKNLAQKLPLLNVDVGNGFSIAP